MGVIKKAFSSKSGNKFRFSIRASNDVMNAIGGGSTKTSQGRNKAMYKAIEAECKDGAVVDLYRNCPPPRDRRAWDAIRKNVKPERYTAQSFK